MQSPHLRLFMRLILLQFAYLLVAPISFAQTIRYVTTIGTNPNPASATSWASSTTDLQGAIDAVAAAGGGEVWVAAGMYKPGGNSNTDRTASFSMRNNVIIYGGYNGNETSISQRPSITMSNPASSTLSGDINSIGDRRDNSYHVIYNTQLDSTAVIDGFVIEDGNADGNSTVSSFATGGGVYNEGSGLDKHCNPIFQNCNFVNNSAKYGGAIYNNGFLGICSTKIVFCSFSNNAATSSGGAIFFNGEKGTCRAELRSCLFYNNTAIASGGAIENRGNQGDSDTFISNCIFNSNKTLSIGSTGNAVNIIADQETICQIQSTSFTDNSCSAPATSTDSNGGTVNISSVAKAVFSNCTFYHNSANNAGAVRIYSRGPHLTEGYFYNCLFRNNNATSLGAAFWIADAKVFFINCNIIQHNSVPDGCFYIWSWYQQAECHFLNSIIWDNGGADTFVRRGNCLLTINNSVVDPLAISYTGTKNNTSNPLFINPEKGDFHLQPCSPGVNAGNEAFYAFGPSTDLDNNSRLRQGQIDIGVYERQDGNCQLQLIEPQYNCTTGEFNFRSVKGEGGSVYYSAIGITSWSQSDGPYIIKPACDVEPFRLQAYQASNPNDIVTYFWNYTATCPSKCNPEVGSSLTAIQPLTLQPPNYNCSTGLFSFRSIGGDGSSVSYKAIGITDWNQSTGPFVVTPNCDVQPFVIQARQASQPAVLYTYYWDYVNQCRQNCPETSQPIPNTALLGCASPASTIGQPLQILSPSYNCQTGSLSIKVTGGNGNIIEYRLLGEELIGWSSSCTLQLVNPAVLAAIRDPSQPTPAFFIQVRQYNSNGSSNLVTYPWNPQASCSGAGRFVRSVETPFQLKVLNNPTVADAIDVTITYVEQASLSIDIYNLQGQVIYNKTLDHPTNTEQLRIPLGLSSGVYLLRVSTPNQQRIVKVIKQ